MLPHLAYIWGVWSPYSKNIQKYDERAANETHDRVVQQHPSPIIVYMCMCGVRLLCVCVMCAC